MIFFSNLSVDDLSGSVRSLITYAFFMLYLDMKVVQICDLWKGLEREEWDHLLKNLARRRSGVICHRGLVLV